MNKEDDPLIVKYVTEADDQLMIFNNGYDEEGNEVTTITISCPHREDIFKYTTLAINIPTEMLDMMLDDLQDDREGVSEE